MLRLPRDAQRSQYIAAAVDARLATTEAEVLASDELVADLQRSWHFGGDQGCAFAMAMSKNSDYRSDNGWVTVATRDVDDTRCDGPIVRDLASRVRALFERADVRIVSLLFPHLTEAGAVTHLLRAFEGAGWQLKLNPKEPPGPDWVNIGVRIPVPNTKAHAFALGFAPLDFLPTTRRAPFTEIVTVAKAKPDWEKPFPMLSEKKAEAHIADLGYYDLPNISNKAFPKLWERTGVFRLERLSGQDDQSAKAGVTFLFPRDVWEAPTPASRP